AVFSFALERPSYSVLESEGVVTVCVIITDANVSEVFTTTLYTRNITTQDKVDHESLRQELSLSANLSRQCFNVTINDDDVAEDDEIFWIYLQYIRNAAGRGVRYPYRNRATIIILDDDLNCTSGCVNGVCRYPGVCQCFEGWIEGDCSREICQPPCVNGRCNVNTGLCDCSPGYTGASCGEVIRHCDEDNGGCDQICTDFPGGYSCSCRAGYSLLTSDGTSCMDIDECEGGSHDCSQICVNTLGSYYCNCQRGFQLANSTHCGDVNECELFPNGFCSQMCVNTDGSFRCECREGYRLFGSSFCTDIDECSEGIDKCNKSGPTPARCINTEGSYSCTCDEHVGYRLATDNITCKDVDECQEQRGLCTKGTEECVNTPGSYSCSCMEGYEYKVDQNSCGDVDECRIMNGGCQQSCTNTFGSFRCSCEQGYRMLDDGFHNCEALSCDPVLEAPLNGSMDCDTQTVGGTCRFTCDEGYTLRGSDSRTCLPSLQWREPPAICDPPMCPHLTPPDNGFVLFPCTREEGHLCRVVCAHGYSLEGPSNQTCTKDNVSLVWSDGPQCVESGLCDPNPCLNGGFCIEAGTEFRCVCNGTANGYGGQTCGAVIVHFLPIPPVTDGLFIPIVLYTTVTEFPDGFEDRKRVAIKIPNQQESHKIVGINREDRNPTIVRGDIGVPRLSLPSNTDKVIYLPRERDVLVTGGSNSERKSHFEQFNLPRGLLEPSCCSADDHVTLSCPGAPLSQYHCCHHVSGEKLARVLQEQMLVLCLFRVVPYLYQLLSPASDTEMFLEDLTSMTLG
ncbi:Latent-transforming growth factor beta-binding protein 1, partial [Geodia barretti]